MYEAISKPEFTPDEKAMSEVSIAFASLARLAMESSAEVLPVFEHERHDDVIRAAQALSKSDHSPAAQATRTLSEIFEGNYDLDGDFDDDTIRAARHEREQGSEQGLRLSLVNAYFRRVVAWSEQQSGPDNTDTLKSAA